MSAISTTSSIEQQLRRALVDKIVEEQDIVGFIRAMAIIKQDTGFGIITHEIRHSTITDVGVKLHWKPAKRISE